MCTKSKGIINKQTSVGKRRKISHERTSNFVVNTFHFSYLFMVINALKVRSLKSVHFWLGGVWRLYTWSRVRWIQYMPRGKISLHWGPTWSKCNALDITAIKRETLAYIHRLAPDLCLRNLDFICETRKICSFKLLYYIS